MRLCVDSKHTRSRVWSLQTSLVLVLVIKNPYVKAFTQYDRCKLLRRSLISYVNGFVAAADYNKDQRCRNCDCELSGLRSSALAQQRV